MPWVGLWEQVREETRGVLGQARGFDVKQGIISEGIEGIIRWEWKGGGDILGEVET